MLRVGVCTLKVPSRRGVEHVLVASIPNPKERGYRKGYHGDDNNDDVTNVLE